VSDEVEKTTVVLLDFGNGGVNLKCFESSDKGVRFAWTTKSIDGYFYAVQLVNESLGGHCWIEDKRRKRMRLVRRWKARNRAFRWFCKREGKSYHSLHSHALQGCNVFERVYRCANHELSDCYDVGVEYFGHSAGSGNHGKDMLWVEDRFGEKNCVPFEFFEEVKDG